MHQALPLTPYVFVQRWLLRWALLFVVLFPLSFPFERGGIIPDPGWYTQHFFEQLARFTGDHVLHLPQPYTAQLISDSTGFYLNALNLLLLSMLGALAWAYFSRHRHYNHIWLFTLMTLVRYYLALQMLWYGFDKVFKVQFYLPEPNTLFTPLGHTQRDILYWSTMGSSYTYTVFAGITELLAAVMLLFHRTYLLGLLFTAGIMVNVLLINIGFDISVKLYSCFLLLLCTIGITIHTPGLYRFFWLHLPARQYLWRPNINTTKKRITYRLVKSVVVMLIFADALAPFVQAGNFNDDRYPRPFLHGAYEVKSFEVNGKKQVADLQNQQRWKRFFVHRRSYFIVQRMNDEMADFALAYDLPHHQLHIKDYDSTIYTFQYTLNKDILVLKGLVHQDTLTVEGKKIDLEQLPLLRKEFGWTVDE
jgi:hypothetical protein